MRLTLRTLLAHMDDILETDQQDQLADKIASSEFASDLVHRTRDTMRRLRLSAPQVVGTGLGLDPNTVAEYLDNTLPVENVADLERICLESDIHLAEVGSCHHVLTMVLGESADIDLATKQRMYRVAQETEQRKHTRIEPAHVPAATASPEPTPAEVTKPVEQPASSTSRAEVPEYLRASRHSALRTAAQVFVTAALLATVAYLGLGFFGSQGTEEVIGLGSKGSTIFADDGKEDPEPNPVIPPPLPDDDDNLSSGEQPKQEDKQLDLPGDVEGEHMKGAGTREVSGTARLEDDETPGDSSVAKPDSPIQQSDVSEESNMESVPSKTETAANTEGLKATQIDTDKNSGEDSFTKAEAEVVKESVVLTEEMGTFWAEDEGVLLRWDTDKGDWFPLAPGTPLEVGDQLMSLPTFRPTVALYSGIWVFPTGASLIVLERNIPDEGLKTGEVPIPRVRVIYGRTVLFNTSDSSREVEIASGNAFGRAVLDPYQSFGVEVTRKWVPGLDPYSGAVPVETHFYAQIFAGELTWEDGMESHSITKSSTWMMKEGEASQIEPLAWTIEWLESEPANRSETMAAKEVRRSLRPDVPAGDSLFDMGDHSRKIFRPMGFLCNAYLGRFTPFVDDLNDSDQRLMWSKHIDTMRTVLGQNPELADPLQKVLKNRRGEAAGKDLFELICGYEIEAIGSSREELQTGVLNKLINWLESDSLDYRVLASHNLREITGNDLFAPTDNLTKRSRTVRELRKRLKQGDLKPVESYGL